MTTLFNLFCPFLLNLSLEYSILMLVSLMLGITIAILMILDKTISKELVYLMGSSLFSLNGEMLLYWCAFLLLGMLNLVSLVGYSYPVTTTLSFNLSTAFSLWMTSIILVTMKHMSVSSMLPSNSPWYLVPFLSVVEFVSVVVRPITLCFRLLANMCAGHILLALITKLIYGAWLLGMLFGLLELMVCLVQSFVFLMLVSVYLEESFSHLTDSLSNVTLKKLKKPISLHDLFIVMGIFIFLVNMFWKWSKALLVVVLMESVSVMLLAGIILSLSQYYFSIILVLSFIVCEALILLSSMYGSLRSNGIIYSSFIFI